MARVWEHCRKCVETVIGVITLHDGDLRETLKQDVLEPDLLLDSTAPPLELTYLLPTVLILGYCCSLGPGDIADIEDSAAEVARRSRGFS